MTPERAVELLKANEERISATDYLRCKDTSIEALEKQIPKKVQTYNSYQYMCECGAIVKSYCTYCYDCGQRIDWSDIK